MDRPYELAWTPDRMVARVRLRGSAVLASPLLNRGTAFTLAEREELGLTGLLPDGVSTIEGQLARVYGQYRRQPGDLAKNLYLASLRDCNEVPSLWGARTVPLDVTWAFRQLARIR